MFFNRFAVTGGAIPRYAAAALLIACCSGVSAQSLPSSATGAGAASDDSTATEQQFDSPSDAGADKSDSGATGSEDEAAQADKPAEQPAPKPKPKPKPKPGNWKVPNVASQPSPLNNPAQPLAQQSFSDTVRDAAGKLLQAQSTGDSSLAPLKATSPLREGDSGEQVASLIEHLQAWGYLDKEEQEDGSFNFYDSATTADKGTTFDDEVQAAVKHFQSDHGLVADGVVGPQVATALNTTPAHQAEALKIWATAIDQQVRGARAHGARYVALINVPSYTLHLIRTSDGKQVLESRVVVGTKDHPTPLFWTRITGLKYSPDWVAPASIAKNGYQRTPPGPSNPLGLLRFTTNNNQAIFLHDTNNKSLFGSAWRARSHGCIRVQQWAGLAETIGPLSPAQLQSKLDKRLTMFSSVNESTLVRTVASVVDVVEGKPTVWPDPYQLGNHAIGAKSLQGIAESDPSGLFATAPGKPLQAGDSKQAVQGAP
ncbi:L,D-transpeptidase family protein [Carnimonas bestiolae]|uniref:L,D-transpeptidase family protein n=1 Tax=Carnimonas bestiolae TaxID=3402172 RepID=UPI003EDCAC37